MGIKRRKKKRKPILIAPPGVSQETIEKLSKYYRVIPSVGFGALGLTEEEMKSVLAMTTRRASSEEGKK